MNSTREELNGAIALAQIDYVESGEYKKTTRDKYCDESNSIGVRRHDGHINAFTYMTKDGKIIHETP